MKWRDDGGAKHAMGGGRNVLTSACRGRRQWPLTDEARLISACRWR